MVEIELKPEELSKEDNLERVEMSRDELWFLKHFFKKYNPKKIVEIGVSAGGNTVNLLNWKEKDAQLYSIDIAVNWYRDNSKVSGFLAEELESKDNWKMYRGKDYLDVYEEIGDEIDFIIIDTVHAMPGEFLSFIAALPQLKDGCLVILHDVHLNMMYHHEDNFSNLYRISAYCNALLFGGVSSKNKWTLKADPITNIGAFIVDESTRENIKDIFHILTSAWNYYPSGLNLSLYKEYVKEHYPIECSKMFDNCLELQSKYFNHEPKIDYDTIKRENEELKKNNTNLNRKNKKLNKDLKKARKINDEVLSSNSWKITEPLRKIKRMF